MKRLAALSVLIFLPSGLAAAQSLPDSFAPGPVIEAFGPSASVDADLALPAATELNVVFDISSAAEDGKVSREFETVARFLNMHVRAGLPREQVQPALVVHGPAAQYLLQPGPTEDPDETTRLVMALLEAGVPIIGTSVGSIELAENREKFSKLITKLKLSWMIRMGKTKETN